jgi:methyl halide transferase
MAKTDDFQEAGVVEDVRTPEFWNALYQSGENGWDLGSSTPVFRRVIQSALVPNSGNAVLLGCGTGHDAILFAEHGYNVTGLDFSPSAIQKAKALAREASASVSFQVHDIFSLPSSFTSAFDLVVEYVLFCAIDPPQRAQYAEVVRTLLRPGGLFLALFFPIDDRDGGPPFAVDVDETLALFRRSFELLHEEAPPDSIGPRMNKELLTLWRKRP